MNRARGISVSQQQMNMIGHERPGQTFCACRFEKRGKAPNEIEAVIIAKKNIAFFYTTYDYVLKEVWNVNASRAGHGRVVAERIVLVKFSRTSP
jgi:hypothetical protein